MGFFDDFSESFADSFNTSYNTSRSKALDAEADAAKQAAQRFLERQEQASELRREDRDRISRAQRLESELSLPEGTWANIYYWDMDGYSMSDIREMAQEGTFNAIPVPEDETPVAADPNATNASGAVDGTETPPTVAPTATVTPEAAQTEAMLDPNADGSGVRLSYTEYAASNGRTGDPTAGQNQEVVDIVTRSWAQVGLGDNIGINSGFRGEDESNHDGNAFDIDVSGLDRDQRIALVRSLSANGARGIGFGNNTIHVDVRGDSPRVWWYDAQGDDTTSIPEALSYSAGVLGQHVGGNLSAGGRPTDGADGTPVGSGSTQIEVGDSPFLTRVNETLEREHTDRVLNILGISEEEYEAGRTRLSYNNVNPSIQYTYTPRLTGDDLPTTWNAAMIAQVMDSEDYRNAETPEARMAILEETRRSMAEEANAARSPKDSAFELLVSSQEYENADAAGRTALLEQFERTWSDLGRAEGGGEDNRTAKQIAFDLYQESDEYTSANPEAQIDLLAQWERQWAEDTARDTSGGSTTLTPARLAQLRSDAEIDLLSSDPAVREAAQNYLENIYPIQERNILAVNSAVGSGDETTFSVRYRNSEGNVVSVTARETADGYVPLNGSQVIENVVEVITPDDMDRRIQAVTQASAVYRPALDLRSAVTVASFGAYELDRMAARSEYVLTTTAGGVSMFEGAKTELNTLMGVIGQAGQDLSNDQESVLAALNAHLAGVAGAGGTMTSEMASQYREFGAAVIRYVFAAGRALGQEGNGFSNSDYDNILSSIVNARSYEAFSNNLRNFTRTQFDNLNEVVSSASQNPQVLAAREAGAGYLVDPALQNSEQYFTTQQQGDTSSAVDRRRGIYDWSQNRAGRIIRYVENVDESIVSQIPSLQGFEGRGVLIFDNGRIEAY